MQLQLQDFTTLVRNMAASVQGSARTLLDVTTGSVLRAVLEANASVALWLQWLIVQVLAQTRAATSFGADLDSWVADFGLVRLPGQAAVTTAVFTRFTPGLAATIPVGAQIKTGDNSQTFAVLADPSNPAFDPVAASFAIPAAVLSVSLPVQAMVPGAAGNVQPGAISLLATAMPAIDAVTNPSAAAGGMDPEPDTALRLRFGNFIDSRARATPAAIAFAIDSLQQGLSYVIAENQDTIGATRPGFFVVTLDNGSGAPPAVTLAAAAQAIEAVRPVGVQFAVQPPLLLSAAVSLTLEVADIARPTAQAATVAALTSYIAALPVGAPLRLSRIAAITYAAAPAVTNVSALAINGAGDLVPPPSGVIKPGAITVD